MTDLNEAEVEPLAVTDYDLPLWLQALSYPAQTDRLLIDAIWQGGGGILAAGDFLVAPRAAGGNMSVDVAPGRVVIAGGDMALQGKYLGRMKNTVNVPLAAAPAAGLTRIDLVYAHVADATVIGGSTNALTVETPITGTAVSSNPVVPALPPTSEPLAQILVASGTVAITAAMITDLRHPLGAGFRAFQSQANRDALWTNPLDGSLALTLDTCQLWRHLKGSWSAADPMTYAANITAGTDAYGNVTVNLPAGAKAVAGVATGSQVGYPHVINLNTQDGPLGGAGVIFSVRNLDGSFVANQTVTFACMVTYTF